MLVEDRQRPDAVRNRERILRAANQVFAESGIAADIASVARRAEVGNATVFRCFPTKDELVTAVVEVGLAEQLAAVRRAMETTAGDAHTVLAAALRALLRGHFGSRCIVEAAREKVFACSSLSGHEGIAAAIDEIIERGRRDGSLRGGIATTDLVLLMSGIAHQAALAGGRAAACCERALTVILDGLRPEHGPLPGAPPTWEDLSPRGTVV